MSSVLSFLFDHFLLALAAAVLALVVAIVLLKSIRSIGATEVGLVRKRFGVRKLGAESAIAFDGEAGYQARLMMPGVQFKLWPVYDVTRHPMVQIPSGQVGVVIAQVGEALPVGAKSATYKDAFGNFSDLAAFVRNGGEKGVQRPVLPPARWCRSIPSASWSSPATPSMACRSTRSMRCWNAAAVLARNPSACRRRSWKSPASSPASSRMAVSST